MRSKRSYQMPAMPKACVRCGTPYGLSRQPYLLGGAPGRRRSVDVPFCHICWRRYTTARRLSLIAAGVFALATFGGVAFGVVSKSDTPAIVGSTIGIIALGAGIFYLRSVSPRRRGEGLEVPGHGVVDVTVDRS